MKRFLCCYLILAICLLTGCALFRPPEKEAQRKTQLVLTYWDERAGDKDQPSYDTKMKVFIDGEFACESDVVDRYERKSATIDVEPGSHVVIIEGYARSDGGWEKRTKDKGYSRDHRLEKEIEIDAGKSRYINFVVPDKAKQLRIKL